MKAFSRFDFLATRGVLALVAVTTPVLAVGMPLLSWARGRPLVWTAQVDPARADLRGIVAAPGATVDWTGDLALSVGQAPTSAWIYSLVPGVVLSVAVVSVAVLLLRLTRRVQRSEAFVSDSVRSLRIIAFLVMMASLCTQLADNVASSAVLAAALPDEPDVLPVTLFSGGAFVMLLTGLLVGVIAEAFAQGTRLADDVAGLV